MATVKKITPRILKRIIQEEKVKLGLATKERLSRSVIIERQVRALKYLKEKAKSATSERQVKFIKEAREAIKQELLRIL